MPAVFVHGVPETPSVWDPLRAHLTRDDVIAVQLPGFGCARPAGFGATKEDYGAWLAGELERIAAQGPIDLVGHDWGGGLTIRLVSTRPDLVRSWVSDAASLAHPDFVWHDVAKIWQTPGAGEQFFEDGLKQPLEERTAAYEAFFGLPHDAALELNRHTDATMAGCILDLYRSATSIGTEWSPAFHDVPAPGLVVIPTGDAFLSADHARAAATGAGAAVAELDGLGHWWMLQDPARGAELLTTFWAGLS